jgi:hypothetical protein
MTFDEFFKKKRIDLDALEKGEPALFSEFKTHYHQMGEKSFDHTKKYWFNKLRLQYPLAIEVKTEKIKTENPLAEQTVIEALIEEGSSTKPTAPKLGFVPKFKAASLPKPATEDKPETPGEEDTSPKPPAPKLGFVPKFKAANMPKPVAEDKPEAETPGKTEAPATESKPASPAYKPRFNMKNIPPKPSEE